MTVTTSQFVDKIPVLQRFTDALPQDNYVAIPSEWYVAVTDVVGSRQAIAAGRYKAVNMAGVSMITAVMNALDHEEVPYIFGGDGAAVVFGPEHTEKVQNALSATVRWVSDQLDLELRAAIVSVDEIHKGGFDLKVAAVRVSDAIRNYAFIGGGIDHAEKLMKQGQFRIEPSGPDIQPDLTGLSCRWTPIEERGRKIVSLIVEPPTGGNEISPEVIDQLMTIVQANEKTASPMPEGGPGFKWPPEGLRLEAKISGSSIVGLYMLTFLVWMLDKAGGVFGLEGAKRYKQITSLNTDYRKIQDGIRMTVSLPQDRVSELRTMLSEARDGSKIRFGMFEQDSAVLTCFVPSIMSDNHYHFLDGAGGGYAAAADDLNQNS